MQFTFLDMAGAVLFIRDDAERAMWTVEEMSLSCEFPYNPGKRITTGQRIFFKDPSTGEHQIYEVKQARTLEPDSYQEVTAENICISELSDCHIDKTDINDKYCSVALSTILAGTGWTVATHGYNPISSVQITRGSVWQAVLQIVTNYNVYIEPFLTLAADGTITRRLDIKSTAGKFNGIRLSIDKNISDPSVIFDDSNTYTALYGYGGTVTDSSGDNQKEIDFSDVVWEATADHPAKPKGQKYLEYPAATAEYGRNGRARFGFYQNSDITDAETLLEKTWESLKTVCAPDISIEGTIIDLYRLGYADQPIKLHELALVEILPAGFKQTKQIIKMTVDLLDPSATTVTIGSYIPNIIYIADETNKDATGSRGGGGGNTGDETTWKEFRTTIESYEDGTGLKFKAVHNDINNTNEEVARQAAELEVTYSMIRQEVKDRIGADNEISSKITQTASQIRAEVNSAKSQINSSITQTASQIRSEVKNAISGVSSSITQTASQIRSEVNGAISGVQSSITQTASQIRSEVNGAISGVQSSITQTASQIRSEVNDAVSGVQSSITQTASQIRSEVNGAVSDVQSSITQTASQIRSEVNAAKSDFSSSITQTASQIRSEVNSAVSGLQSSITQNADSISLVVKNGAIDSASIVAGINAQTGSYVKIEAATINLSGYVTASQLNAVDGRIDNLVAGSSAFTQIVTAGIKTTAFTFAGASISKSTATINGTTLHYLSW